MNSVTIMGNVTRDPELRQVGDTQKCSFGVAINESYVQNGERKENVTFVDVEFWGKQAEWSASDLSKGSKVSVVGALRTDSWDDAEGNKRYKTYVRGIEYVGGAPRAKQEQTQPQQSNKNAGKEQPQKPQQQKRGYNKQLETQEEKIPF